MFLDADNGLGISENMFILLDNLCDNSLCLLDILIVRDRIKKVESASVFSIVVNDVAGCDG